MTKYHATCHGCSPPITPGEGPVDKHQGKPPCPETIAYVRRGTAQMRAADWRAGFADLNDAPSDYIRLDLAAAE
jgi:hypothetical protein